MRENYEKQLEQLHLSLIQLGALCEDAIAGAAKVLLEGGGELREKVRQLERDIDADNREIEYQCVRILLRQQPMASDLRHVTAAQRMIVDMERIGDQAADIAELSALMEGSPVKSDIHIADMAKATRKMVTKSIDCFVNQDLDGAREVVEYDDVVDGLFDKIKNELIERLREDSAHGEDCLNLLMVAKYFERIGDHAENIAEWVIYYLTGTHPDKAD